MMKEKNYVIQDAKFLLNEKILFTATASIEDFLIKGEKLIVLVTSKLITVDRNVYCYDFNGELKWQIPTADELHFTNYYASIYLSNDNEPQAYRQCIGHCFGSKTLYGCTIKKIHAKNTANSFSPVLYNNQGL